MTINQRIRYFRKEVLKINQTVFAKEIGMKQRGVSYMEQEKATVTDRSIKSICLTYNLNEKWLRYGTQPMYKDTNAFNLTEFIRQKGASDLELEIMKAYFDIDPDIRKQLIRQFRENLKHSGTQIHPQTAEELEEKFPPVDHTRTEAN